MNPVATAKQDAGRALWLEQRRHGIGGTDAAAILGVNPYATAFDVWIEKTSRAKAKEPTKAMEWGLLLEDVVADRYASRTGRKLWKPDRLMVHPEHDFMVGTPDRLVIGEDRGVDVKTAGGYLGREWGAENTDEIPRHYIVQAAHYMAITGFDVWDFIVLIGGNDDRIYTVRRDRDLERFLIERLGSWWNTYIVQGKEHPIDHSEGAAAYLADRYPTEKSARVGATQDADAIGLALGTVRAEIRKLEVEEASYVNQLKAAVGDAAGMDGNGWRVTWTGGRQKHSIDHEKYSALLSDALTAAGMGNVVNQALATARVEKLTPRSFRFVADGDK